MKAKEMQPERLLQNYFEEYHNTGYITAGPISVGKVDDAVLKHLSDRGGYLSRSELYITARGIIHAMRERKARAGIQVPESELIRFPGNKDEMSVFFDQITGNYTYTDFKNKYIFSTGVKVKLGGKTERLFCLVTATHLRNNGITEFGLGKYTKIK